MTFKTIITINYIFTIKTHYFTDIVLLEIIHFFTSIMKMNSLVNASVFQDGIRPLPQHSIVCPALFPKLKWEPVYIEEEQRVYDFRRCYGADCPYAASWLATTNLFSKSHWWMESTKMEAASFNVFDKAKFKFQLGDPDAYYVHHLSRFEHLVHRKSGFDDAQRRTLILSETAMAGECGNLTINPSNDFLALIPFYGGLPPNVTKDLTVKSIGQGNSLVIQSFDQNVHQQI